jgi:diguanylate cyclase (GGDEF)-like protein/PAS domain S-box-containing protein
MRILVADDEPTSRLIAEIALRDLGHQCHTVTDGAQAWDAFRSLRPDVVISDLIMPGMSGLELCRSIRAHTPGAGYTYFIMVTSQGDLDQIIEGMGAGADDYLVKPLDPDQLQVRLIAAARVTDLYRRLADQRVELEGLNHELTAVAGSLAEAQSIALVGSWEVDIATQAVSWSRELYRLFDFKLDEKPTTAALVDRTHPDDRESSIEALRATMDGGTPFLLEHRVVLPDGTVHWVRACGRVELNAAGRPERLLGTAQDITREKVAEEALLFQAHHDPLSGLPNRLLLLDRLSRALDRLAREPSTVGVIHLDIDRFKLINDSLGHPVGDQLLLAMATRLKGLIRPADTLARIGGDEFVVLCEGLSGERESVVVADRICAAMSAPLAWDDGEVVMSISAGIALATSALISPEAVLRDADAAMYRAKSDGRARSAVFAETMRTKAIGRLDTEISLRRSIMNGDLRLHYQPIVNVADGQIVGHEALVRWAHPTRGLLGPNHFIAIAEETGLIVPLGAWVVREACCQAMRFQALDPTWSHLTMSVNLSGAQLGQPDLIELISSALRDADLDPEDLQLEMTESVLMDDAAITITILQTLKGLGVRLGVDDFGTGYSSLAYLKRFPVDVLKIDRSFVSGLGKDPEDSALVAAVVSMADALGLAAIAEGVETELQRDCLVRLGCSRAQGFLFARPVAMPEAEALLARAKSGRRDPALQFDSPGVGSLP